MQGNRPIRPSSVFAPNRTPASPGRPTDGAALPQHLGSRQQLEQATRRRVYEHLLLLPGDHFRSIVRSLRIGVGTARHHLQVLVRDGLLYERKADGRSRYYVSGDSEQLAKNDLFGKHWGLRDHPPARRLPLGAPRREGARLVAESPLPGDEVVLGRGADGRHRTQLLNQIDDPLDVVDERRQGLRGERYTLELFPQRTEAEDALTRRGEEMLLGFLGVVELGRQPADLRERVEAQEPVPLELGRELRDA